LLSDSFESFVSCVNMTSVCTGGSRKKKIP